MKRTDSVFSGLNERQVEYVTARSQSESNAKALKLCGFSEGWLYKQDVEMLNERASMFRKDIAGQAMQKLTEALVAAVEVKTKGLSSRDERVRQSVATEIIERILGKPTQRQDITSGDEKITIRLVGNDDD